MKEDAPSSFYIETSRISICAAPFVNRCSRKLASLIRKYLDIFSNDQHSPNEVLAHSFGELLRSDSAPHL